MFDPETHSIADATGLTEDCPDYSADELPIYEPVSSAPQMLPAEDDVFGMQRAWERVFRFGHRWSDGATWPIAQTAGSAMLDELGVEGVEKLGAALEEGRGTDAQALLDKVKGEHPYFLRFRVVHRPEGLRIRLRVAANAGHAQTHTEMISVWQVAAPRVRSRARERGSCTNTRTRGSRRDRVASGDDPPGDSAEPPNRRRGHEPNTIPAVAS